MNLIQKPETVIFSPIHYVFIEKIGPFHETAQKAWQELHQSLQKIKETNQITGYTSLFKVDPKKMIYRAGVSLADVPQKIPNGLVYEKFAGGRYTCFVLTGSWAQLPQACGQAFETFEKNKIQRRDDFCIENYLNSPETTPEDKLITEIMIPTK